MGAPGTFLCRLGSLHLEAYHFENIPFPHPTPTPTPMPPDAELVPLFSLPHLTISSSTLGFLLALGYRTVCPAPWAWTLLSSSHLVPWGTAKPLQFLLRAQLHPLCCQQQPPVETWLTFPGLARTVRPFQGPQLRIGMEWEPFFSPINRILQTMHCIQLLHPMPSSSLTLQFLKHGGIHFMCGDSKILHQRS